MYHTVDGTEFHFDFVETSKNVGMINWINLIAAQTTCDCGGGKYDGCSSTYPCLKIYIQYDLQDNTTVYAQLFESEFQLRAQEVRLSPLYHYVSLIQLAQFSPLCTCVIHHKFSIRICTQSILCQYRLYSRFLTFSLAVYIRATM